MMSLDGFIAGPNDEMDWLPAFNDEALWKDIHEEMWRTLNQVDTILLGRVTYQIWEKYWPAAATNPASTQNDLDFSRYADNVQKIVFSKTLNKAEWKNTRLIKENIAEEIAKLKKQPGKNIALAGGAGLAQTFMKLGLIDEYNIIVHPVILGNGKALFKDMKNRINLKFKATKTFASGAVLLQYQPKASEATMKGDVSSSVAEPRKQEIVISRVFDAPRKLVWQAWTNCESMKQWWGPKTFTTPYCSIDLRIGGKYLNCMRSPDGKDYWSTGTYKEIVPMQRLVVTDSFADKDGNIVPASYYGVSDFPLEMLIIITFEEQNGKTKFTLRYPNVGKTSAEDLRGMEQGWNESFDKLEQLLAKTHLAMLL